VDLFEQHVRAVHDRARHPDAVGHGADFTERRNQRLVRAAHLRDDDENKLNSIKNERKIKMSLAMDCEREDEKFFKRFTEVPHVNGYTLTPFNESTRLTALI
jgi:hypothetical protein